MTQKKTNTVEESSFISHLIELRDRLLRSILAILLIFLSLVAFAKEIYNYLAPIVGTFASKQHNDCH